MTTFVDRSTTITAAWMNDVDVTVNSPAIEALAPVVPAADLVPYFTGTAGASLAAFTSFGRSLTACANVAALASILGLGTAAYSNVGAFDPAGSAAAAVVTANAYTDAGLALKANLSSPTFTGVPAAPTAALHTNTTQLATTAFVVAELATVSVDLSPYLTIASAAATYQTLAGMSAYAPLANPTFTGVPAAPTAAASTNTTQLATCAFVLSEVSAGVGGIDLSGYAPIASPTFTGTVTLPAALTLDSGVPGTVATGRITFTPNVTFDLDGAGAAGSVMSANLLWRTADTAVIPTGKSARYICVRPTVETQGTGNFIGIESGPIINTTDSGYNYAIIGSIAVQAGSGKVTGIYARSGASGTYAGSLVGITCAVTSTALTPSSSAVAISVDGENAGWAINVTSNDLTDCGWGMYVDHPIEIRNSVIGHRKFSGAVGYDPNLLWLAETNGTDITYVLASDGSSRYTPLSAVVKYDLVSNIVGTALYVAPVAMTVATGKQFEGVSVRPSAVTLSGTAILIGLSSIPTISSSAAGTNTVGMQAIVTNAGAGGTYGEVVAAVADTGHTGTLIGSYVSTTQVVGTVAAIAQDLAVNTAAGTFSATAMQRMRGVAAGDKAGYGLYIDASLNLTTSALFYNRLTGNTADLITLYDNANSRNLFQITSAGDMVFGSTGHVTQQYIRGDLSNATLTARLVFQTRSTNANTSVGAIPNGSATTANWRAYSNSDLSAAGNFGALTQITTVTAVDANVINGGTQGTLELRIGGAKALYIDALKNVIIGTGSAISTSATDGFPYVPTCAGTPVGTPTAVTGGLPWVIDSTNKIPYFWSGTAWVTFVTGTGGGSPASGASLGMIVAAQLGYF